MSNLIQFPERREFAEPKQHSFDISEDSRMTTFVFNLAGNKLTLQFGDVWPVIDVHSEDGRPVFHLCLPILGGESE